MSTINIFFIGVFVGFSVVFVVILLTLEFNKWREDLTRR